jgi:hypothetical protein
VRQPETWGAEPAERSLKPYFRRERANAQVSWKRVVRVGSVTMQTWRQSSPIKWIALGELGVLCAAALTLPLKQALDAVHARSQDIGVDPANTNTLEHDDWGTAPMSSGEFYVQTDPAWIQAVLHWQSRAKGTR